MQAGQAPAELVLALGGPPAQWVVTGEPSGPEYWLRVWAARGLLWAWDDAAQPAIVDALNDDAWRVREMAAKVVARHQLGDALSVVADLRHDPECVLPHTELLAHAIGSAALELAGGNRVTTGRARELVTTDTNL